MEHHLQSRYHSYILLKKSGAITITITRAFLASLQRDGFHRDWEHFSFWLQLLQQFLRSASSLVFCTFEQCLNILLSQCLHIALQVLLLTFSCAHLAEILWCRHLPHSHPLNLNTITIAIAIITIVTIAITINLSIVLCLTIVCIIIKNITMME